MTQNKGASGHTPGPWSVRETPWAEGKKHYINGLRGRCLATTLSMESSDPTKKAEVVANARLIAAAPELLAELTDLVGWLHDNQRTIEGEFLMDDLLAGPRAAIAKATGAAGNADAPERTDHE
jgi:hypothetical protein